MFSKVYSAGLNGIDGYLVSVEVDVSDGLPGFIMVGVLASEVREAGDRVRTALKNSGYYLPSRKVTVNLSPAGVRKAGTGYDLAIAVSVLAASQKINPTILTETLIVGELGLDGEVKPVCGILSMVLAARESGLKRCILPKENVEEGRAIPGIESVGVKDIQSIVYLLNHPEEICGSKTEKTDSLAESEAVYEVDYGEVNGQLMLKRATEIAVAGRHNILYIGPAGTGKTMIAQRIPTIMPEPSIEEKLEISKIYSICGMLPADSPIVSQRPFRSPHHSITPQALAGGGNTPRPGELSLASRGVLFLDELPEFQKRSIEILRQPLEEHMISVSRLRGTCNFPANFMLAAAMNPCNCGYYPDRNKCHCTEGQIKNYLGRISKPVLDRFDICVEAAPLQYEELKEKGNNENSISIRARVEAARKRQQKRFEGRSISFNSEMSGEDIRHECRLSPQDETFFEKCFKTMGFSARAYGKILKVARTIADLESAEQITREHLSEAIGYRSLEEKYWGKGGSL